MATIGELYIPPHKGCPELVIELQGHWKHSGGIDFTTARSGIWDSKGLLVNLHTSVSMNWDIHGPFDAGIKTPSGASCGRLHIFAGTDVRVSHSSIKALHRASGMEGVWYEARCQSMFEEGAERFGLAQSLLHN